MSEDRKVECLFPGTPPFSFTAVKHGGVVLSPTPPPHANPKARIRRILIASKACRAANCTPGDACLPACSSAVPSPFDESARQSGFPCARSVQRPISALCIPRRANVTACSALIAPCLTMNRRMRRGSSAKHRLSHAKACQRFPFSVGLGLRFTGLLHLDVVSAHLRSPAQPGQ